MSSTDKKSLALWCLFFLSLRLLYLFFYLEHSWSPEEAYRGSIAIEFLHTLKGQPLRLPFWCYQADSYLGGSLVTGALSMLPFLLMGPSLLALKLSAIWFALATLAAGFAILQQLEKTRSTHFYALLLTFAPPGVVSLSLLAMGYHTESAFFLILFLYLLTRSTEAPTAWLPLAMGFLGGFSFWFSNLNGLALLATLFAWPRSQWRSSRFLILMTIGLTVGLTPWILHESATNATGITHLASSFSEINFLLALKKIFFSSPAIFQILLA